MSSLFRNRRAGSPRRVNDPEERFTQWVTIGFIALIAAVIAIVVAALGVQYWEQHFKTLASVGGTGITSDDLVDRYRLEDFRLEREKRQVSSALAAGEITEAAAEARTSSIEAQRNALVRSALESLIDLIYQGQLAAGRSISVDEAAVDAAIARDALTPEKRKLQIVIIEADPDGVGQPTREERQVAYQAAKDAISDLAAGTPFTDIVAEHSTDDETRANGGEYGIVTRDSALDRAFLEAVFALDQDGTTPLMQGTDGRYRIGKVTAITPGAADPTFENEIRKRMSWDTYRRLVRQEALTDALKDAIVAEGLTDQEQVHVAEIVLDGDPELDAADDSGQIHAAHILYSPNDAPQGAADLPEDDPAWAAAQQEAEKAAAELRAIEDVDARIAAFADKAKADSDDTTSGADGGDLGFFERDTMVTEFGDALFDAPELVRGDIVGPTKTDFGYHVIEFLDRIPPLQERLDALKVLLAAPDADFAAIATAESDGAEGAAGGDLGWRTKGQLDEKAATAVFALETGAVSEQVALGDGYHLYQVIEKAVRALDAEQSAVVRSSAFDDWYDPQKDAAEVTDVITRDSSLTSSIQ